MGWGWVLLFFCFASLLSENVVVAHHDEPWHFHEHGIFRAFFGGFFSTLLLIFGVMVFYYYCLRGGAYGKFFPLFPRKPVLPITVPFARATNYMDSDRPETIVLTAASAPTVFYSNAPSPNQYYAKNPNML